MDQTFDVIELGGVDTVLSICSGTLTDAEFMRAKRVAHHLRRYTRRCLTFPYPGSCADAHAFAATTQDGTVTGWVPACENYHKHIEAASDLFNDIFALPCTITS